MGGHGAGAKKAAGAKGRVSKSLIRKVSSNSLTIEVYSNSIVQKYKKQIQTSPNSVVAVFVDKNRPYHIVDGNHRAKAYQELGMKVPIIKVDRIPTLLALAKKSPKEVFLDLSKK